jgi:hypothetical protein
MVRQNKGGFMRRLALLLGLAAVAVLGPVGVARAVPPEHFPVEHVDETFTIEGECDFPVVVHVEGDIRHTHFFDQAGNEIRDLTVFPNFRVTFTNPETGKSISTVSPAVEHSSTWDRSRNCATCWRIRRADQGNSSGRLPEAVARWTSMVLQRLGLTKVSARQG